MCTGGSISGITKVISGFQQMQIFYQLTSYTFDILAHTGLHQFMWLTWARQETSVELLSVGFPWSHKRCANWKGLGECTSNIQHTRLLMQFITKKNPQWKRHQEFWEHSLIWFIFSSYCYCDELELQFSFTLHVDRDVSLQSVSAPGKIS